MNLCNYVLGGAVWIEQKQAARFEAGAPGKIQESVGGTAANFQKLAVIQSVGRIVGRERRRIDGFKPRWTQTHPGKNGFDFLLRRRSLGDDGVGEALKVLANGVFPDSCVEGSK
jgi:hypothetical protein